MTLTRRTFLSVLGAAFTGLTIRETPALIPPVSDQEKWRLYLSMNSLYGKIPYFDKKTGVLKIPSSRYGNRYGAGSEANAILMDMVSKYPFKMRVT
jgi:hypothetical protein